MRRVLYLISLFVFICSCEKESRTTFHCESCFTEKSTVEHVNIFLPDKQIEELFSVVDPISSDTRGVVFDVKAQADIDFWAGQGLAVIMFWGEKSVPSRAYLLVFNSVAEQCSYPKVHFGKVNVSSTSSTIRKVISKYGITQIPYTLFIQGNTIVATASGPLHAETLSALIEQYKVI